MRQAADARTMIEQFQDLLALTAPPKLFKRSRAGLLIHRGDSEAVGTESCPVNPGIGQRHGVQHKRRQKDHLPASLTLRSSREPIKTCKARQTSMGWT